MAIKCTMPICNVSSFPTDAGNDRRKKALPFQKRRLKETERPKNLRRNSQLPYLMP
jgi:hypothetical protein